MRELTAQHLATDLYAALMMSYAWHERWIALKAFPQ